MNDRQIKLARHALGLPNASKRSYRNHFVTGPGSKDYDDWEAMVAAGHATKHKGRAISGHDPIYCLTRAAAESVLKKGEKLCKEDFPDATSK